MNKKQTRQENTNGRNTTESADIKSGVVLHNKGSVFMPKSMLLLVRVDEIVMRLLDVFNSRMTDTLDPQCTPRKLVFAGKEFFSLSLFLVLLSTRAPSCTMCLVFYTCHVLLPKSELCSTRPALRQKYKHFLQRFWQGHCVKIVASAVGSRQCCVVWGGGRREVAPWAFLKILICAWDFSTNADRKKCVI